MKALRRSLQGDHDQDVFGMEAQREAISRYGIAGRVWETAYALCAYVDSADGKVRDATVCDFDPPFVDDPHEPLGVIGSSECRETPGGFVIATDLPDGNRSDLESDVVFVRPDNLDHVIAIACEFGPRPLTHIVCSDSDLASQPEALTRVAHHALYARMYFPELWGPLFRTLIYIHLTSLPRAPSSGPSIKIIISYKIRSLQKETPFRSAFGLWFAFQPVLARRRVRPIEGKNAPVEGEPDTPEPWRQFVAHEDTDWTFVFVAYCRIVNRMTCS